MPDLMPLPGCCPPQAGSASTPASWAVLNTDGSVSGTPTAADRELAQLAQRLLLGVPHVQHTALVRAEVNRRRSPDQTGHLYLRFSAPGGEVEFWACWGAQDRVDHRRGQVSVRPLG